METGYVYIAGDKYIEENTKDESFGDSDSIEDNESLDDYFKLRAKIGESMKPVQRIKGLQTGFPSDLVLLHTFLTPMSRAVEGAIHSKFDRYNTSGEWFLFIDRKVYNECVRYAKHLAQIISYIFKFKNKHDTKKLKTIASEFINETRSKKYDYTYNEEIINGLLGETKDDIVEELKDSDKETKDDIVEELEDSDIVEELEDSDDGYVSKKKETINVSTNKKHKYECISCNFKTCRKADYTRHLESTKHINNTKKSFDCRYCCARFSSKQGRWTHEKSSCKSRPASGSKATEILVEQLKENNRLLVAQLEIKDKIILNQLDAKDKLLLEQIDVIKSGNKKPTKQAKTKNAIKLKSL